MSAAPTLRPPPARGATELHALLAALRPDDTLADRVVALELCARWLFRGGKPTERLGQLVDALESDADLGRGFAGVVGTLVVEMSAVGLFETGLPNTRGVFDETADRLARRLLPTPRAEGDLGALLWHMFTSRREIAWLGSIPADLVKRLARLVGDWKPLAHALHEAIALAAARIAAVGLSSDIRERGPGGAVFESPFHQLPRRCEAFTAAVRRGEPASAERAACEECLARCSETLVSVHEHLERFGVSVDVVYQLEVIAANQERLLRLLRQPAPTEVLALVTAARLRDRSLLDLFRTNSRLMARKIIERAGQTGEHYITVTRREYGLMLASAAGGGFLTAGTIALKYWIQAGAFPLFIEGLFSSVNYAGSFLVMQLFGFTLATKQPSMTAAALAGSLKEGGQKLDETVTLIARICRSQLAAAIGNIGMVIPAALALDLAVRAVVGHGFFDAKGAEHTFHSLHPTHSGTIVFAALTGAFLWLSSVGAGWLENWVVYRRLPDGIAEHRYGRWVGRRTTRWLARRLEHGVSGIGGNVTLGFLLGMMPVFGRFFGVPLEVRHVTLSTGSLALAVATHGFHRDVLPAAAGIAVIGVLNFGVSFALALTVALRAREVDHGARRLAGAVVGRFLRSPLEFFWPPRSAD